MSDLSNSPALVVRSLTCARGGRRLFSDLGFVLNEGGALVLRGPNASGKSSLLRILAGLLEPTDGQVLWHGKDTRDHSAGWRRSLAYLGHGCALKPQLSVAQNLTFWHAMENAETSVAEALEEIGLSALADLPASMLSAGQQRRLAIARLAMSQGGCWLLDEPTVTLDAASQDRFATMIERHRDGGGLVILATHDALDLHAPEVLTLGAAT